MLLLFLGRCVHPKSFREADHWHHWNGWFPWIWRVVIQGCLFKTRSNSKSQQCSWWLLSCWKPLSPLMASVAALASSSREKLKRGYQSLDQKLKEDAKATPLFRNGKVLSNWGERDPFSGDREQEFEAQRVALFKNCAWRCVVEVLMQDDSSRCSKLSIEESKESAMLERLGPWML